MLVEHHSPVGDAEMAEERLRPIDNDLIAVLEAESKSSAPLPCSHTAECVGSAEFITKQTCSSPVRLVLVRSCLNKRVMRKQFQHWSPIAVYDSTWHHSLVFIQHGKAQNGVTQGPE